MHSIFRLCDYGLPYDTILRLKLKYNNITCEDIMENPNCLNEVLGTKSQRVEEIKSLLSDLINSDQKFSIYDLTYFGLSKSITILLIKNNITINDINDRLIQKDFISDSSYRKIMKSYNELILNNHIQLKLNLKLLLSLIKNIYGYNNFEYEDLKSNIEKYNYDTSDLVNLINTLLENKQVKREDFTYSLVKPRLKEELKKITNEEHVDIVLKKLSGRTLESIGTEYNVTRERIRQIILKELKKFAITREEEKYKEIFETYNFDCDLFCDFFNVDKYVYY